MALLVAGIGDYVISNHKGDTLKTFALGSCVAITIHDPLELWTGLIHIALPNAQISPERAKADPAYFANSGIPLMFKEMKQRGLRTTTRRLDVKITGGANLGDDNNLFNIGKKNVLAVKYILSVMGMSIMAEDVGSNISRTVSFEVKTGKVVITSFSRETLEL